jgi:hypothetical protein
MKIELEELQLLTNCPTQSENEIFSIQEDQIILGAKKI